MSTVSSGPDPVTFAGNVRKPVPQLDAGSRCVGHVSLS